MDRWIDDEANTREAPKESEMYEMAPGLWQTNGKSKNKKGNGDQDKTPPTRWEIQRADDGGNIGLAMLNKGQITSRLGWALS
jgi:hypothetical protein